jgi:hypothetical protein
MTCRGVPLRDWIGWGIANFALAHIATREYGDSIAAVFDGHFGDAEWRNE